MKTAIKRVYEPASKADGYRVLVDRLWPRGMKKQAAQVDEWLKDIAPSSELRKWFDHDPEKWQQFLERYREEIRNTTALDALKAILKKHPVVTLLYAAKDEEHNNAQALLRFLEKE